METDSVLASERNDFRHGGQSIRGVSFPCGYFAFGIMFIGFNDLVAVLGGLDGCTMQVEVRDSWMRSTILLAPDLTIT